MTRYTLEIFMRPIRHVSTVVRSPVAAVCGGWLLFAPLPAALAQQPANQNYEVARLQAALQQVTQEHERIVGLLEQNRQVTQAIIQRLQTLEARVAAPPATQPNVATRADIQTLRDEIRAESRARQKAIDELIKSVSQEISRALRSGAGGATAPPAPVRSQGVYTVSAGDTLSTIAQAFGVTVRQIKEANGLEGDIIRVGQRLNIPAN